MRQAFGAFKAAPRAGFKGLALAAAMALAPGCAILSAKPDPEVAAARIETLRAAHEKSAALQMEVERLEADNAELELRITELERSATRMAALDAPVVVGEALKEGPPAAATSNDRTLSTAPAAPVVAPPNVGNSLPAAPVPIDESPRLVQPSFASTDQIFENEAASSDIKLTSVLWGVHLASYRHAEEASAGWNKLQRENPDELGLLEPRIEKVSIEGKGEYLRLVGGGFSSREKAKALCDTLAVKGVFCRIANFGGDRLSMLDDDLR